MELPDWCIPLPDAKQMREVDRWAIEERGVDGLDLMERAGEAVAGAVQRTESDGLVVVVCGKGNNGGDGLVAARLLREAGREVEVLMLTAPDQLRGEPLENFRRLPGACPIPLFDPQGEVLESDRAQAPAPSSIPIGAAASQALARAAVIVDGLLGTGFSGRPSALMANAIEAVAGTGRPVVAIDVPSGVDASTGVVEGAALRAVRTVSFHACKPGLWINPGKRHSGASEAADIGIPRGAPSVANVGLIGSALLRLLPRRDAASTKFTSGHVLIVGGSQNLTGAPQMSAEAAMRAGAGYVTACVPRSLQPVLAAGGRPEMMTRGLPEHDGALALSGVDQVLQASSRGGAIVLGPGLGRSEGAASFARDLANRLSAPIVIDADGLNAHAGQIGALSSRTAPTILTPHAGELGRLLGIDSEQVERQRLRCVLQAARRAAAVIVLKGDDTLVAHPSGIVAVSPGDSPALASAGTGDVLSGVIAAQLAAGLDAFTAACAGVLMHVLAGRLAAAAQGGAEGVIASDVIDALPRSRAADEGALPGAGRR